MTLQDAMAEVILREILRAPVKFPERLREYAQRAADTKTTLWAGKDEKRYRYSGSWEDFLRALSECKPLPEILSASVQETENP